MTELLARWPEKLTGEPQEGRLDSTPLAMVNYIAPIAQLVSALDFNFKRAVEGSILTAGKRLSLKNLNVIIRAIN